MVTRASPWPKGNCSLSKASQLLRRVSGSVLLWGVALGPTVQLSPAGYRECSPGASTSVPSPPVMGQAARIQCGSGRRWFCKDFLRLKGSGLKT